MTNTYQINNPARLTVDFTLLADGSQVDPSTVTLLVLDPFSNSTEYVYGSSGIVKDSNGKYHYDLSLTVTGYYYYQWEGSGNVEVSAFGQLICNKSPFGLS